MRSGSMRFLQIAILWICSLTAAAAATTSSHTILIVGDSLSAGYGINVEAGWVALLNRRLQQQAYEYRVVNASVSGETTGGGRARLTQLLDYNKPEILILELGSNDGLRGLPLKQVRDNLTNMIQAAQGRRIRVLLIGMQMPPNYGQAYTDGFSSMYTELAQSFKLSLVPFLMDGVALDASLMQGDNMHPNERGQPKLLENVWTKLKPMLAKK